MGQVNDIQTIFSFVDKELQVVLSELDGLACSADVPFLASMLVHFFRKHSKMIRSSLLLAIAKSFNKVDSSCIHLACGIEILHAACLVHDDVLDQSSMRRGQETVELLYGTKAAVLCGDYLLGVSFEKMIAGTNNIIVLKEYGECIKMLVRGELQQLSSVDDFENVDAYLLSIYRKTSVLFMLACRIGGMHASANMHDLDLLSEFGSTLGSAFQLIDDVLDYSADRHDKTGGDDFMSKKITYPAMVAYKNADASVKSYLRKHFDAPSRNELPNIISVISKLGGFHATRELAAGYLDEAIDCISRTSCSSDTKRMCHDTAKYILKRGT